MCSETQHHCLVMDVHASLMHTTRKELSRLLTILVEASSTSVLERVLAEVATYNNVVKPSELGVFQRIHWQLLDLSFAFLSKRDVYTSELVCRHWRFACLDNHAGIKHVMRRSDISDEWLRELRRRRLLPASLPTMKSVHLIAPISVGTLSIVAQELSNLHEIITDVPLVRKHWDALSSLSTLETLVLRANAQETHLALLPHSLTAIDTTGFCLLGDMGHFARLPNLTSLKVLLLDGYHWGIDGGAFVALQNLDLTLTSQSTSDDESEEGEEEWGIEQIDVDRLANMPLLRNLRLGFHMSDDAFSALARLTQIESLDLSWCKWRGRSLDWQLLGKLTGLTHLNIGNIKCGDGLNRPTAHDVQFVSELVQLKTLTLDYNDITDDQLPNLLCNLSALTNLSMQQSMKADFTGSGFASLRHLTKLASVDLFDCYGLKDMGFEAIIQLTNLTYLDVTGPSFSADLIDRTRSTMPNLVIDYSSEAPATMPIIGSGS